MEQNWWNCYQTNKITCMIESEFATQPLPGKLSSICIYIYMWMYPIILNIMLTLTISQHGNNKP